MSLASGTRIGVYEIVAPLGAGGMGEVYRARDSQLKRDVALKTLPEGVAANDERLARFQREAEVLAALNHPHIAQIHGLAERDRVRALIMELVEGDDLAQRISASGAVPVPEALSIARQIAMALDYAHERGIVHRDLKPANIKVTPDGIVKVLDFGLAKAVATAESGDAAARDQVANSPTLTSPAMTQRGVILGTAAYMSPEQAKGKAVDKRSDIWAFGCVLFEMLTGQRTFDGEDVTDSIVAVMSRDPSWSSLPPSTPASVRKLLRRCLEKDRSKRIADIHDALLEIDEAIAHPGGVATPVAAASTRQKAGWLLSGAAVSAVAIAAAMLTGWSRGGVLESRPLDLSFFHTEGSGAGSPHISPDGRKVAYRARRADGMPVIWVRDLATGELRSLAGTEDGQRPFWSPDARYLAFFSNGTIKKVPVDGGPIELVTSFPGAGFLGADWAGDTILFARSDFEGLFSVSAAGGTASQVTELPGPDWAHLSPAFLPDGRRFLFTAKLWTQSTEATKQGVYLGSLDSREIRQLLPDLSSAVYAPPGYLVFARSGKAFAVPFDPKSATVTGEPFGLGGTEVAVDAVYFTAGVSAARSDGALAIRPFPADLMNRNTGPTQLYLFDRRGGRTPVGPPQTLDARMALSPDGRTLAVGVPAADGTIDLATIATQSGMRSPLTTARAYAGWPVWSWSVPQLAYTLQRPGTLDDVLLKDLVTGQTTTLFESKDAIEHPIGWSRDGRHLVLDVFTSSSRSMKILSMSSKTVTPFIRPWSFVAAFSPDDRYLAVSSTESGRFEAYVTTFPDQRQTWPLTTAGGQVISWSADGGEILVATLAGDIAAYPVKATAGAFTAGTPSIVLRNLGAGAIFTTASADHSRLVIRSNPDAANDRGEIRLLFDWASRSPQR